MATAGFMHYSVTRVTLQWPWRRPSHSLRTSPGRADREQDAEWLWTHLQSTDEPGAVAAWGSVLFAGKAGEVWALTGTMTTAECWPSGFMVMPAVWAFCTLFPHQNACWGFIEKVPSVSVFKAHLCLLTHLILKTTMYINRLKVSFYLNLACSACVLAPQAWIQLISSVHCFVWNCEPKCPKFPFFFHLNQAQ